jgi:hypothetical protein
MKSLSLPKLILCLFVGGSCLQAQTTLLSPSVNYNLLNRHPLSNIVLQPPQPATFRPINTNGTITQSNRQSDIPNPVMTNPLGTDIREQNRRAMVMHHRIANDYNRQQEMLEEVKRDLEGEKFYREYMEWLEKSAIYRKTFQAMDKMYTDSFSLTRAVFMVENA